MRSYIVRWDKDKDGNDAWIVFEQGGHRENMKGAFGTKQNAIERGRDHSQKWAALKSNNHARLVILKKNNEIQKTHYYKERRFQ